MTKKSEFTVPEHNNSSRESRSNDCRYCDTRFNSIFCKLKETEVSALNENKHCTTYNKKQIIFHQGTMPRGLFMIFSGKVKLFQFAENGREQIVRMAKAGDVMGYRALLCDDRYSASAEALEISEICFIPKEFFFDLMTKNSTIGIHLLKLLASDLKLAEHKITDFAQKPVRERMAEALLFVIETYGYEEDQQTINVILTREELANIVGTATETAIRLLSDFKQDKIIEFDHKKIKILDMRKLTDAANIQEKEKH